MAVVLTIAGSNKSSILKDRSLRISDELNSRNICDFVLIDSTGAYRPALGAIVTITLSGVTIFAGTIDSKTERSWGGSNAQEIQVSCVDYNQIADRHLVAREYNNQPVGTILTDIITQDLAGEGIAVPGALSGSGLTITKIIFNYRTAAETFDELAQIMGYYWNIDYAKNFIFKDRTAAIAPFTITDADPNFHVNTLQVEETREQYRNRQWIRAGVDLTASRTDSFIGNGTLKSFNLTFPSGTTPTITVNAVGKTVGIRGVNTGKDWYYQIGDRTITQDDGAAALTSGQTLAVTYQGQFPIIDQAQDDIQITGRIAVEGGTGIYEMIEDDPNLNDDDFAHDKALGLLRRYGVIPQIITYETDEALITAGELLSSGDLQYINLTRYGINSNYLIEQVQIEDIGAGNLRARVKALFGEALGGWH